MENNPSNNTPEKAPEVQPLEPQNSEPALMATTSKKRPVLPFVLSGLIIAVCIGLFVFLLINNQQKSTTSSTDNQTNTQTGNSQDGNNGNNSNGNTEENPKFDDPNELRKAATILVDKVVPSSYTLFTLYNIFDNGTTGDRYRDYQQQIVFREFGEPIKIDDEIEYYASYYDANAIYHTIFGASTDMKDKVDISYCSYYLYDSVNEMYYHTNIGGCGGVITDGFRTKVIQAEREGSDRLVASVEYMHVSLEDIYINSSDNIKVYNRYGEAIEYAMDGRTEEETMDDAIEFFGGRLPVYDFTFVVDHDYYVLESVVKQ